jgi:hypothetical protein
LEGALSQPKRVTMQGLESKVSDACPKPSIVCPL